MPYASKAQSNYIHMMASKGTPWAQKFVKDAHGSKVPNIGHVKSKNATVVHRTIKRHARKIK